MMGRLLGLIWGEGVNTLLVYSQENILTTHVHHYCIQNQRTENENSKIKDYKVKKKETCIDELFKTRSKLDTMNFDVMATLKILK